MNAISDGDRLDDRAGDWFFIFHTMIMIDLLGTCKLHHLLKLIFDEEDILGFAKEAVGGKNEIP